MVGADPIQANGPGEQMLQDGLELPAVEGQAGLHLIRGVQVGHDLAVGHASVGLVHGGQQVVDLGFGTGPHPAGVIGVPHPGPGSLHQQAPVGQLDVAAAELVVVVERGLGLSTQLLIHPRPPRSPTPILPPRDLGGVRG